jgi:hypothetical protein
MSNHQQTGGNPHTPELMDTSSPQYQLQPTPLPGQPPSVSRLANFSLICGVLSLILGIIVSLAAIVFGHLARSQVKQSNGAISGAGLALAGLMMGYLSFFFFSITDYSASRGYVKMRETKALSDARQIATGCELYARDNQGAFPDGLNQLVPNYEVFVCTSLRPTQWASITTEDT